MGIYSVRCIFIQNSARCDSKRAAEYLFMGVYKNLLCKMTKITLCFYRVIS